MVYRYKKEKKYSLQEEHNFQNNFQNLDDFQNLKRSKSIRFINLKILTQLDNIEIKKIIKTENLDLIYKQISRLNPTAFRDKKDFFKLFLSTKVKIERILEKEPNSIIFDCDGTLVNTEELSDITFQKIGEERKVSFDIVNRIINATKGMMFQEAFFSTIEEISTEFITEQNDFRREYRRISQEIKKELGIKPTTGSKKIIKSGINFIVASNTPKIIMEENSRALKIPKDKMLSAHDLPSKEGKPSPELFLLAAEKMNSKPAKTLVIEDSTTGIQAGLKGGFEVIIFNNGSNQEVINQFPDLLSISDLSILKYIIRHKHIFTKENITDTIKRLEGLQKTK